MEPCSRAPPNAESCSRRSIRKCVAALRAARDPYEVVFGSGNADAELMFVGEAPGGERRIRQGLPSSVSGRQAAREARSVRSAMEREVRRVHRQHVGGRCSRATATPPARARHLPALPLQPVELIQPTVVCTLGNFATKLLRGEPTGISEIHGQAEVRTIGPRRCGCTRCTTRRPRAIPPQRWRCCGMTSCGSGDPGAGAARSARAAVPEPERSEEAVIEADPEQLGLF